jgi:hypothetical protein
MTQLQSQVSLVVAAMVILAGCASNPSSPVSPVPSAPTRFVQLPLIAGWHDNERVHYITTDVSDRQMAEKLGANFVPRLALAVPEGPPVPGRRSTVERIYLFTNFNQGNIVPSAPTPVGPGSSDKAYSPLWRVVQVTWLSGATPTELRAEEAVLAAEEKGWVRLNVTDIVVNCPIVHSASGGTLPGATAIGDTR